MRYLGLDLGSRTLGMAISDPLGMFASSYKIVRHNEEYERLINDVQETVQEKKIEAIVLGLPKNMNNTIGPKGELSFQFKKMLEEKLNIPVLTTIHNTYYTEVKSFVKFGFLAKLVTKIFFRRGKRACFKKFWLFFFKFKNRTSFNAKRI